MDDPDKPVLNYFNADAGKNVQPAEPVRKIGMVPILILIYLAFRILSALS